MRWPPFWCLWAWQWRKASSQGFHCPFWSWPTKWPCPTWQSVAKWRMEPLEMWGTIQRVGWCPSASWFEWMLDWALQTPDVCRSFACAPWLLQAKRTHQSPIWSWIVNPSMGRTWLDVKPLKTWPFRSRSARNPLSWPTWKHHSQKQDLSLPSIEAINGMGWFAHRSWQIIISHSWF